MDAQRNLIKQRVLVHRRKLIFLGAIVVALVAGLLLLLRSLQPAPRQAPEAQKILKAQAGTPFQILIPAYMPAAFDRASVDIHVAPNEPDTAPMVELTYRTRSNQSLYVREWRPNQREQEVLATAQPIQTAKWGTGWLLAGQAAGLLAIWVDVGPLRVSVSSPDQKALTREQLLQMVETLGPAANRQVFTVMASKPVVRAAPPPPPVEAKLNEQGVQELTLVITPSGYSPLHFAVKKGVPVAITFRSLGKVGCGSTLVFPTDPAHNSTITLASENDKRTFTFTPPEAGEFGFHCIDNMYRGVMIVHE